MNSQNKNASKAHEMLMMNLAIFHLLLPVAALSSGYLSVLLTISLIGSILMIVLIARKSRVITDTSFIQAHWQKAWKRCRLLLLSYSAAALVMLFGLLIASLQSDHTMFAIMLVVFSRIAAVPIILMVLALFVMSMTSLSQARKGVFPA